METQQVDARIENGVVYYKTSIPLLKILLKSLENNDNVELFLTEIPQYSNVLYHIVNGNIVLLKEKYADFAKSTTMIKHHLSASNVDNECEIMFTHEQLCKYPFLVNHVKLVKICDDFRTE